jgi:hypothetical protein
MRAINVFRPDAARAMSHAFTDVCVSLQIPDSAVKAREMIAKRIIELGRQGEHEYERLRDRVLNEADYRKYVQPSGRARTGRPTQQRPQAGRAA